MDRKNAAADHKRNQNLKDGHQWIALNFRRFVSQIHWDRDHPENHHSQIQILILAKLERELGATL